MTIKKSNLFIKLVTLVTLTFSIVYASNMISPKDEETIPYADLSTAELQIKVETLSNKGTLPFEMGLELMKRWQTEQPQVQ
ncbi:MAG: Unknown protein [uncultured Sulfurovum sp.]|uniref:Uncharacterized protein n=1 Tax=uncultured Sulfurovum sp. TaxID=269237 RepID=A0A6S6TH76_9BACT|nr:MAG: Unknown protein [uncultured Sulfurovum sp.]